MQADTPMPGEDPGALIEDPSRLDEIEPEADEGGVPEPRPAPDERSDARGAEHRT